MSYRDPHGNYGQVPSPQHYISDEPAANFNPNFTNNDGHNYQDAAGYSHQADHDMGYPPRQPGSEAHPTQGLRVEPLRRGSNGFEGGEFTPQVPRPAKTLRGLKNYRYENRGNLWTKGGTGHCIGRFCCCTLMIAVLLIASILLTLALWIRPPNVNIGSAYIASSNPLQINAQQKQLTINLGVNISVTNPNYFSISFQTIKAKLFYPINNANVGGGELKNIVFNSNQQTNVTFPFSLDYNASKDPNYSVLLDLAQKCGVGGSAQSNIKINYEVTLGLRALFFVVSPAVSDSASFGCPATGQQIEDFLQSLGISNLTQTRS
ncbi:hypothetical protein APHAL10511_001032 [Amanita phalloides]|nr:hypothetical protein APHAL10511_001032 [Amanita phalloides]